MMPIVVVLIIAFACALAAFDIFAQTATVSEKGAWPIVTYIWVGMWGALGGLVSFAQKVKGGQARWVNLSELLGELFISGFVGILTGLFCEAANFPNALTWGLVGLSGHAGGRAMFFAEQIFTKVAEKHFGVKLQSSPQPKESSNG
jgi:hypothetical protein